MIVISLYLLAFACMLAAMVYRFTFGLRKIAGQTRKTQIVMLTLLGAGMSIVGVIQAFDIALSKAVVSDGWIERLTTTSGRNAHSSFVLVGREGAVWLSDDYIGPRLFNNEHVRVTYRDRTGDVTRLEVLDGRNAGWTDTEYPGLFSDAIALLVGPGLLFGAWGVWWSKPLKAADPVAG